MLESLELRMSETKQTHTEISKKLRDHKKELDSKIDNMQSEILNFRQKLIVDNLCVREEKLEAKIKDLEDSRLGHFESRLDQLSGRFTAVCGTYWQQSIGIELNCVHDINDSHARPIPTSVPSTMSKSQSNCRYDNNMIIIMSVV